MDEYWFKQRCFEVMNERQEVKKFDKDGLTFKSKKEEKEEKEKKPNVKTETE